MVSLTPPPSIYLFPSRHSPPPLILHPRHLHIRLHPPATARLKPPSASTLQPPSSSPSETPYQPFRPPPPRTPDLSPDAILNTLSNRLGRWYEYAPLIAVLSHSYGFSASSIEESTGISGVEQNRFLVASKVRESLLPSLDPETLAFFDSGGAELLYELRLLSNTQRAAAARRLVDRKSDARGALELARAIKYFPSRKGDRGWEAFSYTSPGDCLAFMHFRQSREHRNPTDAEVWLERAAEEAETDAAKKRIAEELQKLLGGGEEEADDPKREIVTVPVVRLKIGEVAEATSVSVLPVCDANEGEIVDAPECGAQGEFGVVVAEKGWRKWVVLPRWEPLLTGGPSMLAVSFADASVVPWKANRWAKEEPILVIADRGMKEVEIDDGFYLVCGENGTLAVEKGVKLKEKGVEKCLAGVILVVRPPREEQDDQISDEEWE
ncbi:rubisco accumulation factor 1.2, chloroplastic-like [Aristolochia californica]|uniref:rubisco accumulation factor 1.2, chloroplastic-like n=1 Tax=Aristolochia californica TaxID=171875 RepID=UPI0035E23FD4